MGIYKYQIILVYTHQLVVKFVLKKLPELLVIIICYTSHSKDAYFLMNGWWKATHMYRTTPLSFKSSLNGGWKQRNATHESSSAFSDAGAALTGGNWKCLEMNWIRAIWKLFQDTKSRFQMVLWPMSDFSNCSVSVPILWSFGKSFVHFVPAVWRPSASVFHGTLMSLTSKETDVHPSRCIWSSCYVRFLGKRVFIKTVTCNRTGLCLQKYTYPLHSLSSFGALFILHPSLDKTVSTCCQRRLLPPPVIGDDATAGVLLALRHFLVFLCFSAKPLCWWKSFACGQYSN